MESVDWASIVVAMVEMCRSDRALGSAVGESTGYRCSFEDCSHYHDTRHGDPFWQAEWTKATPGVGRSFNEPAQL